MILISEIKRDTSVESRLIGQTYFLRH
jgi:hypothetical protein